MHSPIYLDNAATSWPKPASVAEAVSRFLRGPSGNPGRSGHAFSMHAARIIADTRARVARFFGLSDPLSVVFTKNATEALNTALFGLLKPKDHVVTSAMEHNSVLRPLRYLESQGVRVTRLMCSTDGTLDLMELAQALYSGATAVVLTHASNVTGNLIPTHEVASLARKAKALFILDAAQSAGSVPLDMPGLDVDVLVFSGHKSLLGPQGTGGLCLGERARDRLQPLLYGGTGSESSSDVHPAFLPDRLEAGTLNGPGLAGLGAALAFLEDKGIGAIWEYKRAITARLLEGLRSIRGIRILGSLDPGTRVPIVSFTVEGIPPSEVASRLEQKAGVLCRAGLHCAPYAHRRLSTFPQGAVRMSPGLFTTHEEIDVAIACVREIAGQR